MVVDNGYWAEVFGSPIDEITNRRTERQLSALQSYAERLADLPPLQTSTIFIEKALAPQKHRLGLQSKVKTELEAIEQSIVQEQEAEDSDGEMLCLCPHCNLPLGDVSYTVEGMCVHGECAAQLRVADMKNKDLIRKREEKARKQQTREDYGIGWDISQIPLNAKPATKLACRSVPEGMVCLVLQENKSGQSVRVASTLDPAAAVNLEYLSIALLVRCRTGREPRFSLDPVDAKDKKSMQKKVFMPEWLADTSVGEVLFQADYHLKELSMGEYDQPVLGMKSCSDYSEAAGISGSWNAREWFIVRKAEIHLTEGNVLIPHVKMGVEAREQVMGSSGKLEDAPLTRPDHPLVKYAEEFTRNFDLIAERKSVIHHLREVAKASALAKYMMDTNVILEESWFHIAEERQMACCLEVPQLWNERVRSQISIHDGTLGDECSQLHGVYGGVDLTPAAKPEARAPPAPTSFEISIIWQAPAPTQVVAYERPRRPVQYSSAPQRTRANFFGTDYANVDYSDARENFGELDQPSRSAAELAQEHLNKTEKDLRGVDLNLDSFDLSVVRRVPLETPKETWGNECQCLDDCVPIGNAFWADLDSKCQTFQDEDRKMLQQIFQPCLSDRRMEGDRFVPPDVSRATMDKLRSLLHNEDWVRMQRREHFMSKSFSAENPGPLFPSSWTTSFKIASGHAVDSQRRLVSRPELLAEVGVLEHALSLASPVFSSYTEESVKFCVYRLGTLEVRTTQEPGSKEIIGAVFSAQASSTVSADVAGDLKILRASLYVERVVANVRAGKAKLLRRYYVVLETEDGDKVATHQHSDGKMSFEENPVSLEDRNSLAKVMQRVDAKPGMSVADFKTFQAGMAYRAKPGPASQSACKRYARAALAFTCGDNCAAGVQPKDSSIWQSASKCRKKTVSRKLASTRPPSFVGLPPAVAV
jgi:hypothetical protein